MSASTMTVRRAATLALLSWTLVVTEPTPRTIKTGFPTKDAGEEAAKDAIPVKADLGRHAAEEHAAWLDWRMLPETAGVLYGPAAHT